ncbi:MAG: hypothetical protein V7646_5274 [Pseudonocardia sp.]
MATPRTTKVNRSRGVTISIRRHRPDEASQTCVIDDSGMVKPPCRRLARCARKTSRRSVRYSCPPTASVPVMLTELIEPSPACTIPTSALAFFLARTCSPDSRSDPLSDTAFLRLLDRQA